MRAARSCSIATDGESALALVEQITPDRDAAQGMLWMDGPLSSFFPGIQADGDAELGHLDDIIGSFVFDSRTGFAHADGNCYSDSGALVPTELPLTRTVAPRSNVVPLVLESLGMSEVK